MTIGERIKYFREGRGMTQDELAEHIGTTKQTIYKYENNIITNIPSDKIENLANIFGISPVVLMGWDSNFAVIEQEICKASARNLLLNPKASLADRCDAKLQEYLTLYARSLNASNKREDSFHPLFSDYVSMMLNQQYQRNTTPSDVYEELVKRYGILGGIDEGSSYWHPCEDNEIHTIAAHHEGDEWTDEELAEIEEFKKFVLSKRK